MYMPTLTLTSVTNYSGSGAGYPPPKTETVIDPMALNNFASQAVTEINTIKNEVAGLQLVLQHTKSFLEWMKVMHPATLDEYADYVGVAQRIENSNAQ
jgi:hypothetical protein